MNEDKVEIFLEQRQVAKILISLLKFKFSQTLLGDTNVTYPCSKFGSTLLDEDAKMLAFYTYELYTISSFLQCKNVRSLKESLQVHYQLHGNM